MGERIGANEVYDNRYYRIPKALFRVDKYKKLSSNAKLLYGFLDDRRELSLKNNWVDEDNHIYLIFSREEVCELLCLTDKTVTKAFKELRIAELIDEVRRGINKPNIIYVRHLDIEDIDTQWNRKKYDSRNVQNTNQEPEIIRGSEPDFNEPDFNEPDFIYGANEVPTTQISPFSASILKDYLTKYFYFKGRVSHPKMAIKQLVNIDYFITATTEEYTLDENDWETLMDKHFETNYPKGCDYKAQHFFTEGIIKNRHFETLYQGG